MQGHLPLGDVGGCTLDRWQLTAEFRKLDGQIKVWSISPLLAQKYLRSCCSAFTWTWCVEVCWLNQDILQSMRVNKPPAACGHAVKVSGGRIISSSINQPFQDFCLLAPFQTAMPLKFTHGLSPVYSSVSLLSHAPLFFSARSMALTLLICCWLVNLSSLFPFSSPLLCFFWLGLLSGASWGKACSLPVCLCLLFMLFLLCVSSLSLSITTAGFLSELNAPIKRHISFSALLLVISSHILAFISMLCNCVCVTSVFNLHQCNHLFSTNGICVFRDCL